MHKMVFCIYSIQTWCMFGGFHLTCMCSGPMKFRGNNGDRSSLPDCSIRVY